jgi:thioredoxin reductase
MREYDVVVVGGGAAGLSAALVLSRSRRRVIVVDAGEYRNASAGHLHGFLTRDGMTPEDFLAAGRSEVISYGGEIVAGQVQGIEQARGGGFVVGLTDGTEVRTRGVLTATGLRDEVPEIEGAGELWGGDVALCPYCHGYEVRDGAIGVLGGENRPFTMHQVVLLRQWSDDVMFFPHRIELSGEERERLAAYDVRIVEGEVARLVTEGSRLSGIEMAAGEMVPRSAVFVGPRFLPRDELLKTLGCEVGENGFVAVDPSGRTSVPGVWAAGNVVDSPSLLVNAASAGSTAAIALNHFFLAEDVQRAVEDHRVRTKPFSHEMEQKVCETVLGESRHGIESI